MYVLGINGWDFDSHDSSACLFFNGKLIAAAEEERFIRQKKSFNKIPCNAISYCLNEAKISPNDIEHIVIGWDVKKLYFERYSKLLTDEECLLKIFPKEIFKRDKEPKIHICSHHLAHAAGTFFSSGFEEATILVVDGVGEEESITIAKGFNNKIEILEKYPLEKSLGIFYEALTVFCGFSRFDEGKLMGLSSYGSCDFDFSDILDNQIHKITNEININEKYFLVLKNWLKIIYKTTKINPNETNYNYDILNTTLYNETDVMKYKNIAASGQVAFEKAIIKLVKKAIRITRINNLCISGGVALNCIANRKILELEEVKELYIQPAAADNGVSIGAAAWFVSSNNIKPEINSNHVYSGPDFSDNDINMILKKYNIPFIKLESNKYEKISELLVQSKVIGRFNGKMEFGPRALGNRSIIANPQTKDMLNLINNIKKREYWRPLAPSIIKDQEHKVLKEKTNNEYMLLNSTVIDSMIDLLPAITHFDNSTRAQVFCREMNKDYYETIKHFYKDTGLPVVLNTSFNVGNEPIVCNPSDAIRTFYSSGIDALLLGSFLIIK